MEYIFFSALCSICIFIIFKLIHIHKLPNLQPIIINYVVAVVLGFILSSPTQKISQIPEMPWIYLSFLIGILFIIMFFLIALSSQKAGISVTTIASKMSVVIPVLFSILYYNESVTWIKITAIAIALLAVFAAVYKKSKGGKTPAVVFILPVFLFIGLGSVDMLVKYAQNDYVKPEEASMFTAFLFFVSLVAGLLYGIFQKRFFKGFLSLKVILTGTILGAVNFGSIFFLILALNNSGIDSSFVFGITNITIVAVTVITGRFAFREPMTWINWTGMILSLIAIYLMIHK